MPPTPHSVLTLFGLWNVNRQTPTDRLLLFSRPLRVSYCEKMCVCVSASECRYGFGIKSNPMQELSQSKKETQSNRISLLIGSVKQKMRMRIEWSATWEKGKLFDTLCIDKQWIVKSRSCRSCGPFSETFVLPVLLGGLRLSGSLQNVTLPESTSMRREEREWKRTLSSYTRLFVPSLLNIKQSYNPTG